MFSNLKKSIKFEVIKRLGYSSAPALGQVSYAQEGEDVLLWRIISPSLKKTGIYVDVGCNHPWHYSNTGFLYEKGWRGIAIDPNPEFASEFAKSRPEDTFINMGVSDESSELTYYRFNISFYNTFSDEIAKNLVDNLIVPPPSQQKVKVDTLARLLERVWPNGKEIDLLSIDAEGLDFKIVCGHDFVRYPVKYIIIEPDAFLLAELTQAPVIKYLANLGFTPVSKLSKSVILIANTELKACGL